MTTAAAHPDVLGDEPATPSRQERLVARVAALRTRGAGVSADRWLLVVGGVLMPLGVVFILLGWLGASRTPLVFEQIPYMISGGLLGLALVFAGGFLYFAYWQTLLVREQRQSREDLAASLRRIEELLAAGSAPARPVAPVVPEQRSELVATQSGSMLHRPDCVAVAGRENLRTVTADTPGLTPCRLCEPLLEDPVAVQQQA
jgi:hypothetical protein